MRPEQRMISKSTARTLYVLLLAALCSGALSVITFELILRNTHLLRNTSLILGSLILAFTTVCMPFAIAFYATFAAFRRRAPREGLLVICAGYLAVLVSFAGVYYSFNIVSDYHDSIDQASFYLQASKLLDKGLSQEIPERATDRKAFQGMRYPLWSGLDDEARPALFPASARITPAMRLKVARRYEANANGKLTPEFAPKFNDHWRLRSWLQCFHFSVVTMATVGYGDVFPKQWYSHLAVDMQILIGQILVVVALGCVLGKWWERPPA